MCPTNTHLVMPSSRGHVFTVTFLVMSCFILILRLCLVSGHFPSRSLSTFPLVWFLVSPSCVSSVSYCLPVCILTSFPVFSVRSILLYLVSVFQLWLLFVYLLYSGFFLTSLWIPLLDIKSLLTCESCLWGRPSVCHCDTSVCAFLNRRKQSKRTISVISFYLVTFSEMMDLLAEIHFCNILYVDR